MDGSAGRRYHSLGVRQSSRSGTPEPLGPFLHMSAAAGAGVTITIPLALRGEIELGKKLLELFTDLRVVVNCVHLATGGAGVEDLTAVALRVPRVEVSLAEGARLAITDRAAAVRGRFARLPLKLCPLTVVLLPRRNLGVAQDGLCPQVPLPPPLQVVPLNGEAIHPRGGRLATVTSASDKHHLATTFLAQRWRQEA